MVDTTGSFVVAFLIAGACLVGSALAYGLLLGKIAPLSFPSDALRRENNFLNGIPGQAD